MGVGDLKWATWVGEGVLKVEADCLDGRGVVRLEVDAMDTTFFKYLTRLHGEITSTRTTI